MSEVKPHYQIAPKPLRLTAPKPLESAIQAQILTYLRVEQAQGRIGPLMRVNGGMARYRGGQPVKNYRLWIPGADETSSGMADVNGVYGPHSVCPGRFFALEVKRYGEKPNAAQIAYLEAIQAAGGVAAVVRDWTEAKAVLFGAADDRASGRAARGDPLPRSGRSTGYHER